MQIYRLNIKLKLPDGKLSFGSIASRYFSSESRMLEYIKKDEFKDIKNRQVGYKIAHSLETID